MYQVLFQIDGEWFHLDGLFNTLDSAIEKGYMLKNGFYTARLVDMVEIVKIIVEHNTIVSRELIQTLK